jgi:hypothetical protein
LLPKMPLQLVVLFLNWRLSSLMKTTLRSVYESCPWKRCLRRLRHDIATEWIRASCLSTDVSFKLCCHQDAWHLFEVQNFSMTTAVRNKTLLFHFATASSKMTSEWFMIFRYNFVSMKFESVIDHHTYSSISTRFLCSQRCFRYERVFFSAKQNQ